MAERVIVEADPMNPVFGGVLALMAGNLLGSSVDGLIKVLEDRANLTSALPLNESTKKILDKTISILFQVSALSLGTYFVSSAFPWITSDPGAFTLWVLGIGMSSTTLKDNVLGLNNSLRSNVGGGGEVNAKADDE